MLSILKRPLFNAQRTLTEMSEKEISQLKKYQRFRKKERWLLKQMHDVVIVDDGIPRLQKRGYGLKGYK